MEVLTALLPRLNRKLKGFLMVIGLVKQGSKTDQDGSNDAADTGWDKSSISQIEVRQMEMHIAQTHHIPLSGLPVWPFLDTISMACSTCSLFILFIIHHLLCCCVFFQFHSFVHPFLSSISGFVSSYNTKHALICVGGPVHTAYFHRE